MRLPARPARLDRTEDIKERIICYYCGTEYYDTIQRCPLCGTLNETAAQPEPEPEEDAPVRRRKPDEARRKKKAGAYEAEGGDRIPKWISVLICVILGLAVVIGALYALYAVGVFTPKKEVDDSSLTLPIEEETQDTQQEETPDDSGETEPQEPEEVLCTGITVTPASVNLDSAGIATSLNAVVLPTDCTEKITWSSSDPTICTVDSDGVVTAVDGGKATVTAQCGSYTAEVEVTCNFANSKENNAYLSTTDFTLFSTGEQATIQVLDAPAGATVTWSSSNTGVCTVSGGKVTAVKAGTATVTAMVNDKELTCTVRCNIEGSVVANDNNAETVGGYRLDHTDVTLAVGTSFEISVVDGISGGWNVSDSSVITVDGNGNVTALASGTATVYTVVGGQRLECIVRVP